MADALANTAELPGGFAQPGRDSQQAFRQILEAMAHPGRIVETGRGLAPPAPLHPASAAVCLSLLDHDTAFWLDPAWRRGGLVDYIRFHTGALPAPTPTTADFLLSGPELPALESLTLGSDTYPDRSATLIVQLEAITPEGPLRCTGPGIETATSLGLVGLDADFIHYWRRNNGYFPRGVDAVFTAGTRLCCLARTTRLDV